MPTFIQAYDVFHIESFKVIEVEIENEVEELQWYTNTIENKKDNFKFSVYYKKPSVNRTDSFYPSIQLKCFCPPPEV